LKAKAAKVPHTDNVELPTPDDHLDFIFKHPPPRQAPTLAVASFYGLDDDSMHNVNFNSDPRAYCFFNHGVGKYFSAVWQNVRIFAFSLFV
jgi:hypothetical protein